MAAFGIPSIDDPNIEHGTGVHAGNTYCKYCEVWILDCQWHKHENSETHIKKKRKALERQKTREEREAATAARGKWEETCNII